MSRRKPKQSGPAQSPGKQTTARPSADAAQQTLLAAVHHHQAGRLDDAAAGYQRVLDSAPRQPDALHLMGVIAHQRGEHDRALALVRQALKVSPKSAAYHNTLGTVLLSLGRADAAATSLRRALSLDSGYVEAHNNLGNAMMRAGDAQGAERCYRRALALRPDYAVACNNLGGALRKQGKLDEAAAAYQQALAHQPTYAGALCNLGRVLHEQGRYQQALAHYDRALALDPSNAEAHANRATVLLLLGRLPEGWEEYEWRWRVAGFTTPRRTFAQPLWDGGDLAGRTILVHAEQGLGSAIQFVRYVKLLAERGAGGIVLECQRPLARLFAGSVRSLGLSGSAVHVVVKGEPLPPFHVHAPMMSLPRLLGTDLPTIPNEVPYLSIDRDLSAHWQARLSARRSPRVGLVWAGNPNHDNDINRSMPADRLGPLIAVEGVSFINLQVGRAARDLAALPRDRLSDVTPEIEDFADTAAIVGQLDLVISVDTAVAHLAGALSRPVWLLVPFVPEWRWMLDRTDSPWYPTMRLFRQSAPGDWADLMTGVAAELRARADAGSEGAEAVADHPAAAP